MRSLYSTAPHTTLLGNSATKIRKRNETTKARGKKDKRPKLFCYFSLTPPFSCCLFSCCLFLLYTSDTILCTTFFAEKFGSLRKLFYICVNIKDGIVKGEMPGRALRMILEWLEDHRQELMANWEKAQKGEQLDKIEPLK